MANIVNKMSKEMGNAIVEVNSMDDKEVTEMKDFLSSFTLGMSIKLVTCIPEKYHGITLMDLINNGEQMINEIVEAAVQAADENGVLEDK